MKALHPKVKAATNAGVGSIVGMVALALLHVKLPPEVCSAITTLVAFAAGYLQPA